MDPFSSTPSVWPLEGEDDLGLRWRGDTNSGLPTHWSASSLDHLGYSISSLDQLDYRTLDPTFHSRELQVPQFLSAGDPRLEQEVIQLRMQNAQLIEENEFLKAQLRENQTLVNPVHGVAVDNNSTLRENQTLVNPVHGVASADLDNDLNDEELDCRDFPKVKFWFRTDWSKSQGKIFIETGQGVIVTKSRLKAILKCARQFWEDLRAENATPPSWGQATPQIKNRYHNLMRNKFPEFKLCHNNWKADLLATGHYSPWYHYWVLKKDADKLDGTEIPNRPSKRQKTKSMIPSGPGVVSSLDSGLGRSIRNAKEDMGWTDLPIIPTPSSEPTAGSSKAENVFTLSNPFLDSQAWDAQPSTIYSLATNSTDEQKLDEFTL